MAWWRGVSCHVAHHWRQRGVFYLRQGHEIGLVRLLVSLSVCLQLRLSLDTLCVCVFFFWKVRISMWIHNYYNNHLHYLINSLKNEGELLVAFTLDFHILGGWYIEQDCRGGCCLRTLVCSGSPGFFWVGCPFSIHVAQETSPLVAKLISGEKWDSLRLYFVLEIVSNVFHIHLGAPVLYVDYCMFLSLYPGRKYMVTILLFPN